MDYILRTSNDQVRRVVAWRDAVGLEDYLGLVVVHVMLIKNVI